MRENLDPRDWESPAQRDVPADRPLADREVPLGGRDMPAMIHAWLDGELPETSVRHGDGARDVDFWLRVDREMAMRRRMTTPVGVLERVMEAIPSAVPNASLPWHRREITVSPLAALAFTAFAMAVGVLVSLIFMHGR